MLNIHKDYSLLGHNTFGIDARTAAFVEYSSEAELLEAARMLREGDLPSPWLHIGGGSNLLLTRDWPGAVLHSRITGCETVSENEDAVEVRVGSGVVWDDFVEMCVERGWYGAENLSAIPGETGAAAVQNIGAYGVEVKDLILEVETLDMSSGQKKVFPAGDCGYGYRRSIFKQQDNKRFVVLSVLFRLGLRPQLGDSPGGAFLQAARSIGNRQRRQFLHQSGRAPLQVRGTPAAVARNTPLSRSRGLRQTLRRMAHRAVRMEGPLPRKGRGLS